MPTSNVGEKSQKLSHLKSGLFFRLCPAFIRGQLNEPNLSFSYYCALLTSHCIVYFIRSCRTSGPPWRSSVRPVPRRNSSSGSRVSAPTQGTSRRRSRSLSGKRQRCPLRSLVDFLNSVKFVNCSWDYHISFSIPVTRKINVLKFHKLNSCKYQ